MLVLTLIRKKMQMKTILGYYATPINLAKIAKFGNVFCWQGWVESSMFMYFWWQYK